MYLNLFLLYPIEMIFIEEDRKLSSSINITITLKSNKLF
jgi:hypothetical protein